jgi:hypothetical protein
LQPSLARSEAEIKKFSSVFDFFGKRNLEP